MPCSKYKSKKQRALCFATLKWKDWTKIKEHPIKLDIKANKFKVYKYKGVGLSKA